MLFPSTSFVNRFINKWEAFPNKAIFFNSGGVYPNMIGGSENKPKTWWAFGNESGGINRLWIWSPYGLFIVCFILWLLIHVLDDISHSKCVPVAYERRDRGLTHIGQASVRLSNRWISPAGHVAHLVQPVRTFILSVLVLALLMK